MPGRDAAYRQRREKAVREALSLLDHLCRDSLDMPLASAQTHPDHGEISATFARLAWLIEELRV